MYSFSIKELFENNYPLMLCVCILLRKNQADVSMKSIDGLRRPFIFPVFWHRSVQLDRSTGQSNYMDMISDPRPGVMRMTTWGCSWPADEQVTESRSLGWSVHRSLS